MAEQNKKGRKTTLQTVGWSTKFFCKKSLWPSKHWELSKMKTVFITKYSEHIFASRESCRPCKTCADSTELLNALCSLHHTIFWRDSGWNVREMGGGPFSCLSKTPDQRGLKLTWKTKPKKKFSKTCQNSDRLQLSTIFIIISLPQVDNFPFCLTFWHHFGSSGSLWLVLCMTA